MNFVSLSFCGVELAALGSGALWWPERALLVVSDLHFGKALRLASDGGATLPPYEMRDTLARLEADIEATRASHVICLGDSFDAPGIEVHLPDDDLIWLTRLQAGRRWTWIEGNHDPAPVGLGGSHLADLTVGPLTFRHIATDGAVAEVSGHYHPKMRLPTRGRMISRACFLGNDSRLILPAFGTYTGGLACDAPVLTELMGDRAFAVLTGPKPAQVPVRVGMVAQR